MHLRLSQIAVTAAAAIVLSGLAPTSAQAAGATRTWTGLGGDNSWTNAANWDTVPAAGDDLVFPDIADNARHTAVNDFAAGTTFASVTIGESGYTLSGNGFGAGVLTAAYASGTSSITTGVLNPGTIGVASGATLTLGGTVSGTAGITKTGGGTALLSAANTFSGPTAVTAGTVAIANSSALGASTTGNGTDVASGATLEVRGTINTGEPLTIAGTGVNGVGALYNGTGNNVVQGVVMTGDSTIGAAAGTFMLIPTTLGQSGGPFRMTKVGAGVLDVLATSSYTRGTVVASGTLATEGTVNGAISVQPGATLSAAGGSVGDVTSLGGTVTPGFSSSPFDADATSLTLDSGSTFYAQLNGTATGNGSSGHSRLSVAQATTLNGASLTATVSGYTPTPGDALTILATGTTLTGTFAGLPEGGYITAPGGTARTFRISYTGGDGNDIVLTSVASGTTALTSSANPSTPGQAVALTATISPSGATGTVTFKEGATVLDTVGVTGGTAVLNTSTLTTGSHPITATYNGNAGVAPSTSPTLTQVVADAAPDTTIATGPTNGSLSPLTSATFTFTSPDTDVASYECSLDSATYAACTSPRTTTGLNAGSHTFAVRAIDNAGNVDPTPATRTWTTDLVAPVVTVLREPAQPDPVRVDEVVFLAEASEPVGDLSPSDVSILGATGADGVTVRRVDSDTFRITVSGMKADGTVQVRTADGAVHDPAGNTAGSSLSDSVAWERALAPALSLGGPQTCSTAGAAMTLLVANADAAVLTATSSNERLLPASRIDLVRTGDTALLTVRPRLDTPGTARVRVRVTTSVGTAVMDVRVRIGTDGSDVVLGGNGVDVLFGLDGDDVLRGRSGDDLLCAGAGDDRLRGGTGDDTLHGQSGNDRVRGGAGSDGLYGDEGDDVLVGDRAHDTIVGGPGRDQVMPGQASRSTDR